MSNEKLAKMEDLEENELTLPNTQIIPLDHQEDEEEVEEENDSDEKDINLSQKSKSEMLSIICEVIFNIIRFAFALIFIYYQVSYWQSRANKDNLIVVGYCPSTHRSGHCDLEWPCCEEEYSMYSIKRAKKYREFWGFEILTRTSSKVMFKNVSELVAEQAILTTKSSIEERYYFHEMGDKIGTDMTALTGQKWFSIVGNRDSFDLTLSQFSAYILIAINDMKVFLFRVDNNLCTLKSTNNEFKDEEELPSKTVLRKTLRHF